MQAKLVAIPASIAAAVWLAACGTSPPQAHPATMTVTVATPAPTTSSTPAAAPPPVAVGQTAIDGAFAFTVGRSDTDNIVAWDEPGQVNAQGIFVIVHMQVENVGRSSQTYSADYQRLSDGEGRQFSPDLRASQQLSERGGTDINPGNKAYEGLVFDVPDGTQPNQYVLLVHGSLDSHGATLSIPPPPPPKIFAPTADDDQRFLEKLASDPYVPLSGRLPVWAANPALAVKAGRDS
jgi:Domain of unknown function (DUF4352)